MKKTITTFAALFLLLFTGLNAQTVWNGTADTTWYTSNTSATEYTISTAEELAGLASLVNAKTTTFSGKIIRLTADIRLNDTTGWSGKITDAYWTNRQSSAAGTQDSLVLAQMNGSGLRQWMPVGNDFTYPFQGTFDGGGYTISGLYIDGSIGYAGLFGFINTGAVLKNIHIAAGFLKTQRIDNFTYVGSLAGYAFTGSVLIDSCHSDATVSSAAGSQSCVGGLVGSCDAPISNSYAMGNVSACNFITSGSTSHSCGGLVGYATSSVNNCYAVGNVDAFSTSPGASPCGGGLVGDIYKTAVSNCYASGNVYSGSIATNGYTYSGGLVGYSDNLVISNSYTLGNAHVFAGRYAYVGGLAAYSDGNNITNCYAAGTASKDVSLSGSYIGGLIGRVNNGSLLINAYYNSTLNTGNAIGSGSISGTATGKTTAEMQSAAFATLLNGQTMAHNDLASETDILWFGWQQQAGQNGGYPSFTTETPVPDCKLPRVTPGIVTSASAAISWTAGGTETQWNMIVSETPVTDFSGYESAATTTATDTLLTGLNAATTYYVYMRSHCSAEEQSLWANVITFTTPYSVPFAEEFTSSTFPPTHWNRYTGLASSIFAGEPLAATTAGWGRTVNPYGLAAPHAKINIFASQRYWLVSPAIYLEPDASHELSFDLALTDFDNANPIEHTNIADDKFMVIVSTDNGATWSQTNATIWDNNGTDYVFTDIATTGEKITIDLSAYSGTILIAFYTESTIGNGNNDLHIDNIAVKVATCPMPKNTTVDNITTEGADISWTAGGEETQWNLIVSDTAVTDFSGINAGIINVNDTTLTGLLPTTTYYIYVRAYCAEDDQSSWVSGGSFTTKYDCGGAISSFPWTEDFENETKWNCWLQEHVNGTIDWTLGTGSTSMITTAHSGTNNACFSHSSFVNYTTKLISPVLDITGLTHPELTFWYGQPAWDGDINELKVYYRTSETSEWVQIAHYTEDVSAWTEEVLPLPASSKSATYQIAFEGINNWGRANVIDDVTIAEGSTCPRPIGVAINNITPEGADISWTANGEETQWNLIVSETAITDFESVDSEDIITTGNNPYTITGLSPAAEYYVYVRAYCGDADQSRWTSASFRTACRTITSLPWAEGFEDGELAESCWSLSAGEYNWDQGSSSYVHTGSYFAYHQNNSGIIDTGYLVSPQIAIPSDGNTYQLKFWTYEYSPSAYERSSVLISTGSADPASGDFVEVWFEETPEILWKEVQINLSAYAGKEILIAFCHQTNTNYNAWLIDDVSVEQLHAYDAEVVSITSPESGLELTDAETVTVNVKNKGTETISNFTLSLKVNGTQLAAETYTDTLDFLETAEYTFTQTVDLSVAGDYVIEVTVNLANDEVAENNTATKTVTVFSTEPVTLYGYKVNNNDYAVLSFKSDEPDNISRLSSYTDGGNSIYSGDYVNGYLYGITSANNFIKLDTDTWTEEFSIPIAKYTQEMTYDYSTGTMYAFRGADTSLVTVNLETGELTPVTGLDNYYFGLACNLDGVMYGIAADGGLYTIDKITGVSTLIGKTGFIPWFIQSMAFDHNTGRLFWAAYQSDNGVLMELNPATAAAYNRGLIGSSTEVTALHTPYTLTHKAVTPANESVNAGLKAAVSVEFYAEITASDLSGISISPDPGGVSASISEKTLTIAHSDFEYEVEYTVTVPAGAIEGYDYEISWSFTTRTVNTDATLADLTVSEGELSPAFSASVTSYSVNVPYETEEITITATASDAKATITGTGAKTLVVGANEFSITVTAEDGTTKNVYKVTVTRANEVGIAELTTNNGEWKVYPNPTRGKLRITNYESGNGSLMQSVKKVEVFDINGRKLSTLNGRLLSGVEASTLEIDLSRFANGVYILRINDEKTVKVVKE